MNCVSSSFKREILGPPKPMVLSTYLVWKRRRRKKKRGKRSRGKNLFSPVLPFFSPLCWSPPSPRMVKVLAVAIVASVGVTLRYTICNCCCCCCCCQSCCCCCSCFCCCCFCCSGCCSYCCRCCCGLFLCCCF